MSRAVCYRHDLAAMPWDDFAFSDATKIRVDATDGLRLFATYNAATATIEYPTSGGPWTCDTPTVACGAFRGFLAFDAAEDEITDTPDDLGEPTSPGTTIRYQLLVGGSPYYWNGSAWVAAGGSNYNTRAQVQANITHATLTALVLAASGSVAVRVFLATSHKRWTPQVTRIDLLINVGNAVGLDDAVVRTLQPALEAIDVEGVWRDVNGSGGSITSIDLAVDAWRRKVPYRYSAITAVYDLTADPSRATNLYSSVTLSSSTIAGQEHVVGTISLSSSIADGNVVEVQFTHRPRAEVHRHRDFAGVAGYEVSDVPEWQIRIPESTGVIRDPDLEVIALRVNPGDGVNDSYVLSGGRKHTVELVIAPRAELEAAGPGEASVAEAMGQALRDWLDRERTLTSAAFGTPIGLRVLDVGSPAADEVGLLQRFDHTIALYSVREPGAATPKKVVRTGQLTGGPGPQR